MELASLFSGFDGHAAWPTLPRASAASRPPLPAKRHGVLLAKLVPTSRLGTVTRIQRDKCDSHLLTGSGLGGLSGRPSRRAAMTHNQLIAARFRGGRLSRRSGGSGALSTLLTGIPLLLQWTGRKQSELISGRGPRMPRGAEPQTRRSSSRSSLRWISISGLRAQDRIAALAQDATEPEIVSARMKDVGQVAGRSAVPAAPTALTGWVAGRNLRAIDRDSPKSGNGRKCI
jgi:hypothetical protein